MENSHYTVKIHPAAEGGFWAEVPALPGCLTRGDTLEEVIRRVRGLIEGHLRTLLRRGEAFPVEKPQRKAFTIPVSVRAPRRR